MCSKMQGIKLITFDATNTLLKFRLPPWHFYAIVAKSHGFRGTPEDLKLPLLSSMKFMLEKYPNFGHNSISWPKWWQEVVRMTFRDKLPGNIEVVANELIQMFQTSECWNTASGTNHILQVLRKHGKSIGVISNFDPRLHEVLLNLQLHDKLDFVLTSYEVGISKPNKLIFDSALEKCKGDIKPNESLHIGDDYKKDYIGARAAGWHAILVAEGKYETPPASNHVFTNLVELSSVIENNTLKL